MSGQTPAEFFDGNPSGLRIYRAIDAMVREIGPAQVTVSKSQVAFRRRKGFAFVWKPSQYVRSDVPAVISFGLPRPVSSARIKETAHPSARVWMHHVELRGVDEVDDQLRAWVAEAYAHAG